MPAPPSFADAAINTARRLLLLVPVAQAVGFHKLLVHLVRLLKILPVRNIAHRTRISGRASAWPSTITSLIGKETG